MFARRHLKLDKTGRFGYTAVEMRELAKFCDLGEEEQGASSTTQPRAESEREEVPRSRAPRRSNR